MFHQQVHGVHSSGTTIRAFDEAKGFKYTVPGELVPVTAGSLKFLEDCKVNGPYSTARFHVCEEYFQTKGGSPSCSRGRDCPNVHVPPGTSHSLAHLKAVDPPAKYDMLKPADIPLVVRAHVSSPQAVQLATQSAIPSTAPLEQQQAQAELLLSVVCVLSSQELLKTKGAQQFLIEHGLAQQNTSGGGLVACNNATQPTIRYLLQRCNNYERDGFCQFGAQCNYVHTTSEGRQASWEALATCGVSLSLIRNPGKPIRSHTSPASGIASHSSGSSSRRSSHPSSQGMHSPPVPLHPMKFPMVIDPSTGMPIGGGPPPMPPHTASWWPAHVLRDAAGPATTTAAAATATAVCVSHADWRWATYACSYRGEYNDDSTAAAPAASGSDATCHSHANAKPTANATTATANAPTATAATRIAASAELVWRRQHAAGSTGVTLECSMARHNSSPDERGSDVDQPAALHSTSGHRYSTTSRKPVSIQPGGAASALWGVPSHLDTSRPIIEDEDEGCAPSLSEYCRSTICST